MTTLYIVLGAVIALVCASGWIYGLYHRGESKGLRGDVRLLGEKLRREIEMHDDSLSRAGDLADALEVSNTNIARVEATTDYWRNRYEQAQSSRVADVSGDALRDLVNRMQLDLADEGTRDRASGGGGEVENENGDGDEGGDVRETEGSAGFADPDQVL